MLLLQASQRMLVAATRNRHVAPSLFSKVDGQVVGLTEYSRISGFLSRNAEFNIR
jgi:hypothetical protein